jgi:hypothetical protein
MPAQTDHPAPLDPHHHGPPVPGEDQPRIGGSGEAVADHLRLWWPTVPPGGTQTPRELRVRSDGSIATDEEAGKAFLSWARSMATSATATP